jgi:hypothetical protein
MQPWREIGRIDRFRPIRRDSAAPRTPRRETTMTDPQESDTLEFRPADDPLARHFGPSPPPVRVAFGALSHRGLVR